MKKDLISRRGKFEVDRGYILDCFEAFTFIMSDFVVLHTNSNLATDKIEYYGCHPDFDSIDYGATLPEYRPIITKEKYGDTEAGPPYTVKWEKL